MFLLHLRLPVAGKVWTWHSWENEYAWTALAAAFNRPFSCRWTLDLGKPMAAKTTKIPQVNEQTKQLRSGQVSTGPYAPSLSETHQKALRFLFKTWSGLQQRSRNDRYRTKLPLAMSSMASSRLPSSATSSTFSAYSGAEMELKCFETSGLKKLKFLKSLISLKSVKFEKSEKLKTLKRLKILKYWKFEVLKNFTSLKSFQNLKSLNNLERKFETLKSSEIWLFEKYEIFERMKFGNLENLKSLTSLESSKFWKVSKFCKFEKFETLIFEKFKKIERIELLTNLKSLKGLKILKSLKSVHSLKSLKT